MVGPQAAVAGESARRVVLGRVVGAHGLRGQLRVRWLGDGPENLLTLRQLVLAGDPAAPAGRACEVVEASPGRSGEVRMRLGGVASREAAEGLRGLFVTTGADALAPLPDGEWYWFEVVGCRVEDEAGQVVGTVREIWETGAADVLVVDGVDGRRRLVPAAAHFLKEVDVRGRRIAVEAIAGLLDPL